MSFKSNPKSRRLKNQQPGEQKESPFFQKMEQKEEEKQDESFFQTKLTVGQPGDRYEKEADSVANAVVNRSNHETPSVQEKEISSIQRTSLATPAEDEKLTTAEDRMEKDKLIQEQADETQKEEENQEPVQAMHEPNEQKPREEEENQAIQQKSTRGHSTPSKKGLSKQLRKKKNRGKKMSTRVRKQMESAFGKDFAQVNIHTDDEAVSMNQKLHAQAFTTGNHIYFNQGKYNPETGAGQRLLAHELTHVVQQTPVNNLGDVQINRQEETQPAQPVTGQLGYVTNLSACNNLNEVVSEWVSQHAFHFIKANYGNHVTNAVPANLVETKIELPNPNGRLIFQYEFTRPNGDRKKVKVIARFELEPNRGAYFVRARLFDQLGPIPVMMMSWTGGLQIDSSGSCSIVDIDLSEPRRRRQPDPGMPDPGQAHA